MNNTLHTTKKLNIILFVVSVIVSAFLNCVFTPFVFAEERTYEGVGEYVMSDFETPDIAKQRAKSRAEQNAVEQAGVYVDSYTKSVNAVIVRDEITVITNGILRVIDTKYSFQPLAEQGGSFLVQARIKAVIDTKLVDDWLKQSAEQKQQLVIQIEELTNNTKELEKEIASLKQQLATAKTKQDTATIKKEMEANDKKFQANEKRKEGLRLLYDTKDYNSGLACFNEAIKLDPDNALSYCNRAEAYILIRQYLQAIADCNKAIALNPEEPKSYRVRAHAYMCTSDPQGLGITNNASLAIADINKFLSMKPLTTNNNVLWHVYFVRAGAYAFLNQPARAVPDFDKAIEYKSTDPLVFVSRAWMLWKLKQYDRMLADCNKAIEMDPKCEGAYVFRACFYIYKNNPTVDNSSRLDTSQFPLAIADLNKAIELKPDYIDAYLARSFLYEKLGNKQQAQADLARARELGYNK